MSRKKYHSSIHRYFSTLILYKEKRSLDFSVGKFHCLMFLDMIWIEVDNVERRVVGAGCLTTNSSILPTFPMDLVLGSQRALIKVQAPYKGDLFIPLKEGICGLLLLFWAFIYDFFLIRKQSNPFL